MQRDLYEAQAKRKIGKLAMIAVANKLIRQAFAVVAHDKEYIDGFVSNRP